MFLKFSRHKAIPFKIELPHRERLSKQQTAPKEQPPRKLSGQRTDAGRHPILKWGATHSEEQPRFVTPVHRRSKLNNSFGESLRFQTEGVMQHAFGVPHALLFETLIW